MRRITYCVFVPTIMYFLIAEPLRLIPSSLYADFPEVCECTQIIRLARPILITTVNTSRKFQT